MKKRFLNKIVLSSIVVSNILLTGCNESESEAVLVKANEKVEVQKENTKSAEAIEVAKTTYTKYDSVVSERFKDVAKIGPDGKYMLLIFGTNTDPYSARLKADVKNSSELTKKLKEDLSSYYLKAHENLRHKLFHEGEFMDVDTKTMISIYGVEATPTLIFTDKNGKAIIVVPGYMPTEQFITTIKFIESKKWEGKDRKNGEVYEALRNFYIENGINVTKKEIK